MLLLLKALRCINAFLFTIIRLYKRAGNVLNR